MNTETNIKIRKHEYHLRIAAMGVIVFGVWSFIKLVLQLVFRFDYIEDIFGKELVGDEKAISIAAMIILVAIDVFFRVYIGKHALYEAKGIKKGYVYIAFAFLLLTSSAFSLVAYFREIEASLDMIADIVTELTSFFITFELISASLLLKKYRKINSKKEV